MTEASGSPARHVAFATLGCKLNQFETDSIATRFRNSGYEIVEFDQPADVYVINSCTVTNRADRKSRNLLYRARRARTDDPLIVLTGCYVDSHRDALESSGNTYYVPNEAKQSIPELVEGHFRGEVIHPTGTVFDFQVPERIFHTRSIVKIQDGCDNYCTFCIIPYVRGHATSRPWNDVVGAVREAVQGGAREVVLTGVNMSRYRDGAVDFTELVSRCLELGGDYRLRISSLEPDQLTDRFLALFAHPRMAPHLHLCLQSGSERVLLAMRRQYSYELYRRLASAIREHDPLFNITTDIIVGFPGETDDDLAASLEAIDSVGFGHVHTFPYSLRTGTRAERMPGHISSTEKTRRAALVRSRAAESRRRYRERFVGREETLLVEKAELRGDTLFLTGLGEHYVPIELRAHRDRLRGAPAEYENTVFRVRITELAGEEDPALIGTLA